MKTTPKAEKLPSTIDPNLGIVPVIDERLDVLTNISLIGTLFKFISIVVIKLFPL